MNEEKIRELRSQADGLRKELGEIVAKHILAFGSWVLAQAEKMGLNPDEINVRYCGNLRQWRFEIARKKDGTDSEADQFGTEFSIYFDEPYFNRDNRVKMNVGTCGEFDSSNAGQVLKYALAGMLAINLGVCLSYALKYEAETRELAFRLARLNYEVMELERVDRELAEEAKAKEAEEALKIGDWYADKGSEWYAYEIAKVTPCYVFVREYKRYDYYDRKSEWWPCSRLGRLNRYNKRTFLNNVAHGWYKPMAKPDKVVD